MTIMAATIPLTAAGAQEEAKPAKSCAESPGALPETLSGWANRGALNAGANAKGAARLTPGHAIDATLLQTGTISYVVRPEKPGGSTSYGGLFAFTVEQPGTYRVALGAGAWIDVLKGKDAIVSTAHGHGPECSGIRKMVDFPLTPGDYVLQIAGSNGAALPMMVTRLP